MGYMDGMDSVNTDALDQVGTAALFRGPGAPVELVRVARPTPAAGEVLVRVTHCTLCRSDLHTYEGRRPSPGPCVLGHEMIGEVLGWGGAAPPRTGTGDVLRVGDRVTWSIAVGCGRCFFCQHGLPQKCEALFKYGHEAFDPAFGPTGGLADLCRLRAGTCICHIPENLPAAVACPANCATATVAAALRLVADVGRVAGSSAIVSGVGMLGLTACAMLAEAGAAPIVAVDVCPERLALSREFGATHTALVDDGPAAASELVAAVTDGRGADLAFDFAGVSAAVAALLPWLRIGGVLLLAGSVFPDAAIAIEPEAVVRGMLTIRGLHNYHPDDLQAALAFLSRVHQRCPFANLVSEPVPLREVDRAFRMAQRQEAVRVLVSG